MRSTSWVMLGAPTVIGAAVMIAAEAPVGRWSIHLVSCAVGVMLAAFAVSLPAMRFRSALTLATVGLLAVLSTLTAAGVDGVTRWHVLGPLRLNASAIVAPALVVFAASLRRTEAVHAFAPDAFLMALQVVHLAQPDAGQSTAVGAAAVVIAHRAPRVLSQAVLTTVHVALVGFAWSRPDPLMPAPFVEDIIGRAHSIHVGFAALSLLSLGVAIAAPLFVRAVDGSRVLAAPALSAYFAGSALAAALGEFPTPLIGSAPSVVLGAWLGMAMLIRSHRSATLA